MNWDDLTVFLALARTGSLRAAGSRLASSPQTIARRVARLETDLGITLFTRTANGYFLTDEGNAVLPLAEAAENRMREFEHAAAGRMQVAEGTVRLATAENFATLLLIPALPALYRDHPKVRLEFVTGVAAIGLNRYEADLALRAKRPENGNLTVQRLARMAYAVYATPGFLDTHPASAEAPLDACPLITWDDAYAHLPAARWLSAHASGPCALATTSLAAQVAACRAGLGLAVLPCVVAEATPGLVPVIGPDAVFADELWLVTQADLAGSRRVAAVADWIRTTVAEVAPTLEGRRGDRPD
ncbi:LysR family transcriptional regulator [Arhodomonas sp. AD133]|uniref:LysR family transcriptional regulator n=1 Tax=Arhodomonas sp. AD133 TaxID=3415009 RepID=UPI003EBAAED6